jgi:hypothetical protein
MTHRALFLYDNGPTLRRVVQRPIVRALLAQDTTLALGVASGDEWLFADLVGPRCRLVVVPLPASRKGALVDLRRWCPPDHVAIDCDTNAYADTRSPDWAAQTTVVARRLAAAGLHDLQAPAAATVPMADLPAVALPWTPARPTVYLDLDRHVDPQVHFVFDLPRLLAVLPDHDFACTAPPAMGDPRLVDVSRWSPLARATLSTCCDVLVGSCWLPFVLTLHERNRDRAKVVCGFDPFTYAALWDYPGNPLEHVATMDELAGFLAAHRRRHQTRPPALAAGR